MEKSFLSVSQVNSYIKSILEDDVVLSEIFITGEISNFKRHSSGHLYFSLKDENASIYCVMFKLNAINLDFKPNDGMKVMVFGRISLYEKTGAYQLYAELMQGFGKGELHIKFEALKNKLYNEGLFDIENKKPIPKVLNKVILITSPTSAAVRDMIKMAKNINENILLLIIPTLVQGEDAPRSIVEALKVANKTDGNLIVLGRGGGSIEDLWAFNDEEVARAISKSKIPIISAIGHETDYTIADFVSDLRAPTPSAAISMSFPSKKDLEYRVYRLVKEINDLVDEKISDYEREIIALNFKGIYNKITNKSKTDTEKLLKLIKRLEINTENMINKSEMKVKNNISLLHNMSPLNIMERGYSIILKEEKIISSVADLNIDDNVLIMLSDGKIKANIKEIEKGK